VQHISVGNLLRRLKNNTAYPNAGVLESMLNKQELIDANILVPILKNELEELESRDQGRRVILVDGFPRNLEQQRVFENTVSMLASKLAAACYIYITLYTNVASSSQNLYLFYSSTVLKKLRNNGTSRVTWKGGRRMTRQCSKNDIRSIYRRMSISYMGIGRGGS
jgi:adenylate kinase family enzyme